jgi:Ni/Co efflux regulator RcnB
MKNKLLSAAVALSMLAATPALAQWRDHGGDGGRHAYSEGGWRGRGADPWAGRRWGRGDRLPREYWSRNYEVRDYRRYRLRQPPRGYHWVRTGTGDFVLAALATGVIADIIANSR